MAVSIVIDITQNSQSVANNTTNVTVKVNAKWTGGSYNLLEKSGSCTIDGTKYTFTSPFNTGRTTSGSCNLYTKTLNITHVSDGTKTLYVSASYTSGVSSGTVVASTGVNLTTIPRKSTLSVANGTLGTLQALTVARQSSSFTHTITYKCDQASGTLCTKSSSTSVSWTPPLSLASMNLTGTSVYVSFTITTYNGNTSIGSTSCSAKYEIPASVKPSCTVSVSDAMGYKDKYGGFIQNKSKFAVTITPTLAYSSPIKAYAATANGAKYTKASFTTGLISQAGTNHQVAAQVTDSRGRTSDQVFVKNLVVLAYSPPDISEFKVRRINIEDLTPNPDGKHIEVSFDSTVTPLNNKNTATYKLEYKETSAQEYSEVDMTSLANVYEVSNAKFVFDASPSKSYDVRLTLTDDFGATLKILASSTKNVFMSQGKEGTGISFGKTVEFGKEESLGGVGVAEFEFDGKFNKPVYGKVAGLDKLPYIPSGGNLNDYLATGCWAIYSNSSENLPSRADQIYCGDKLLGTDDTVPPARAGRFEVISATGEGVRAEQYSYLRQKFYPYNSSNAVWERDVTRGENDNWVYFDWWQSSLTPAASERVYKSLVDKAAITVSLGSNVTLGVVNTYTTIPFSVTALKTSNRLSLFTGGFVKIGAGIQHVKVSGQTLIKTGVAGQRHARIQKMSGSTTTSYAWDCIYAVANANTLYPFTPIIIPVAEGDFIRMVFYTPDADDYNVSGSAANGWQSYLTVEEL